ncbi:MAG TPA: PLP-dependent aminotransferase family protein [Burkholderiaceae bacterium]|nr:PLP-dependent aminotransferase family protein [Burkholderiaceae bacterium]
MNTLVTGATRIEQTMDAIRRRIALRQLTPGARVPSIRQFAADTGVSKSTVVEAYERLAAEGVIHPRRGSGFYVAGHLAPLALSELGPRLDREVDPLWVARQSLDSGTLALKPGCGWLPNEWMPQDDIRRALRGIARAPHTPLTDYAPTLGQPGLRRLLAQRLQERGMNTTPAQILLTDSGTQAIDLLCRFLIEPGDTVLVDDPCYFNFLALLRAHQVRIVSVPFTTTGPDLELFAATLAEHQPRLYITNSALHNPTGASLSPLAAHRILKLAEVHDLVIIEDDIFSDFESSPSTRLAAFDGLERVIQIGSFSKTLSASARCGYIAARADWVDSLADLRIATAFSGCALTQSLVQALLEGGGYRRHVETLRQRLADATAPVMTRLERLGITPWAAPRGGMFLWCRLPHGLDGARLAGLALAQGLVLAPGNVFSLSQTASGFMRFNPSQMAGPRVFELLETAMNQAATMADEPRAAA